MVRGLVRSGGPWTGGQCFRVTRSLRYRLVVLCRETKLSLAEKSEINANGASQKLKTPVFKDIVFWRLNERFMPNRTGDIFHVCRDASDNNKVHYATDSSSCAARQNFPRQKNLKLMQTAFLRNLKLLSSKI